MAVSPTLLAVTAASSFGGIGDPEICAVGRLSSFKGVAINLAGPSVSRTKKLEMVLLPLSSLPVKSSHKLSRTYNATYIPSSLSRLSRELLPMP